LEAAAVEAAGAVVLVLMDLRFFFAMIVLPCLCLAVYLVRRMDSDYLDK
jgi:hypothetical protein